MAKNGEKGNGRKGAVKQRSQFYNPVTKKYVKRNTITGEIMNVKSDGKPFKGVSKE
ncbi:hypothetical protein [Macrococcus brunensis]|uniref:hypothetical protein n=1 Tax=Macrococcus brunensis TaxID=198483 RepID=UPI001EF09043|nr:hypothetical protein [Macrococcus brunensis]ULG72399.1 hypothetical protein MGG12_02445 [Macrococcus brunensis]